MLFRHALPNAILPIIAMIGIDIGIFMSGIVVVESVFGWPGIGQLAWQAIQRIDIPIIMGVTLVSACAIVLGNLLADLVAPAHRPAHQGAVTTKQQREQEKTCCKTAADRRRRRRPGARRPRAGARPRTPSRAAR